MRKISLDPEALAALNAEGTIMPVGLPKSLPDDVVQVIRKQIAGTVFGPSMKPTFRQQLFTFVSFAAIKASWAADNFQRMQRRKA